MLASGREISQKEKEHITTQMATGEVPFNFFFFIQCNITLSTGMRAFLTMESSMAKASSSMVPWTNMKETSSTAGENPINDNSLQAGGGRHHEPSGRTHL